MQFLSTWMVFLMLSWTGAEDVLTSLPIGSNTRDFYPLSRETQQSPPSNGKAHHFEISVPEEEQTQFQTIENNGRYSFGFATPDQDRTETRSGNGAVSGSFFYVDTDSKKNKVFYRADSSGYRVLANNIAQVKPVQPVPYTAEEEAEREQHFKTWRAIADSHREYFPQGSNVDETIVAAPQNDDLIQIESSRSEILEADPSLTKPVPVSPITDVENQAVIITGNSHIDESDDDDIRVDAEPIRLLAQLYGKHSDNDEIPEIIPRPQGFRPNNLATTNTKYDLFQRAYHDTVELINPEYVDLRSFLLTNRFRNAQPEGYDTPIRNPQELHNYYYGLPSNSPLVLTREGWVRIPESLKYAIAGTPSIDGEHDVQLSPFQKIQSEENDEQFRQYLYHY